MNKDVKNKTLRRLAIAEGHLKKIEKMVRDEEYCPKIIHQSRAVQSALKKIDEIILHGHLHTCVFKDIHAPQSKNEKIVKEIVELFSKSE